MQLVTIENDTAAVALAPLDCLRLAQACAAAEQALSNGLVEEATFDLPRGAFSSRAIRGLDQLYAALAVAFAAAAVAGQDAYQLHAGEVNVSRWARLRREYGAAPEGDQQQGV